MSEFNLDTLLETGAVLAGGSLRDLLNKKEPKDYDLFFCSEESLKNARIELLNKGELIAATIYTETYTYQSKMIQLVFKKIYGTPESIINDFDFNICRAFRTSEKTFYSIEMMSDMGTNEVTVNVITKPIDSLRRLGKYVREGFDVTNSYHYILDVMKDKSPAIILNSAFYE